ncbi:MAG: OmpH family outer membrane protein [Verrucomicrobiaceae bacterium]
MPTLRTLLILLSLILVSHAAPKIATVDVGKVIGSYHVTEKDSKELQAMREALNEDKRAIKLKETQGRLETAIKALQDAVAQQNEQESLLLEAQAARADYEDIYTQWQKWYSEEMRKINEDFVSRSRATLNKIAEASRTVGDRQGYDWVLDINGSTSSQVPAVLYVRDATDISTEVLAILNKDAPVTQDEETSESPSNNN